MVKYWDDVERFSHVIGDFNWTSYDYISKAGFGEREYVDTEQFDFTFELGVQKTECYIYK